MSVTLSYESTGRGGAKCTLNVDGVQVTVPASYLSDALGDLAAAVVALLRGHPEPSLSFAEEPGTYRWVLNPVPPDRVRIRVMEFPNWPARLLERECAEIFSAECRVRAFAGALASEMQRLATKHGAAGYRAIWGNHDFPGERLAEIRTLLRKHGDR